MKLKYQAYLESALNEGTERSERFTNHSKAYHASVGKYTLTINKAKPYSVISVKTKNTYTGNIHFVQKFKANKNLEKEFDSFENEKDVEAFINSRATTAKGK